MNPMNFSEQEKRRRWDEIKLRQSRLMSEMNDSQSEAPAHMDHIMKSGFTMNDLKGLNRNFGDDGAEADDMLRANPQRPPRKTSLTQNGYDSAELNVQMQRSASALNIERYQPEDGGPVDDGGDKKRSRSPFKFFKSKRSQSKDKFKSKSKSPDALNKRGNYFMIISFRDSY